MNLCLVVIGVGSLLFSTVIISLEAKSKDAKPKDAKPKDAKPSSNSKALDVVKDADIEWSYTVPQYGNITMFEKVVCREDVEQNLAWLRYENFDQCVTLVTDTAIPFCLYNQLERNNLTVINKDKKFLLGTIALRQLTGPKCGTFMILTQDFGFIDAIFGKGMKHHFHPFTRIYLFIPPTMDIPFKHIARAVNHGYNVFTLQHSFFDKSMSYFNLNYWNLKNIATNQTLQTSVWSRNELAKFYGTVESHPLFNASIFSKYKKIFRIGVFDCHPYIILNKAGNITSGLEYWFIEDVARAHGWDKIVYRIYNKSRSQLLDEILNHKLDMSVCSPWLSEKHHNSHGLTGYFDQQCVSIMVPRQKPINVAAIIFLSLNSHTWLYFGITFMSIVAVLTGISKIGLRMEIFEKRNLPYRDLSTAFIETISTVSQHGVSRFPFQTAIRYVIFSWIIFSFVFGILYTSGYVSLMTSLPLTKPLDTLEDFVKSDLKLAKMSNYTAFQMELKSFNESIYTAFANKIVREHSKTERLRNIYSGQYGYIATKLSNQYIANIPMRRVINRVPLRLMKTCLTKHYTTFAFKPQSAWAEFFSIKLKRYQESGIVWHWFNNLLSNKSNIMDYYLNPPKSIGLLDFDPLNLIEMSGVFYLWAVGMAISFLVFLGEIFVFRMQNRVHQKRKSNLKKILKKKAAEIPPSYLP